MNSEQLQGADSPLRIKVEGDELVIRVGVNRIDGHDCHPTIPALTFEDRAEWIKDVIYQMENEEEDGATPISDLIDACMNAALEYGSIGVAEDSPTHMGVCDKCTEDQVALRHTKDGQVCTLCAAKAKEGGE